MKDERKSKIKYREHHLNTYGCLLHQEYEEHHKYHQAHEERL